jgi:superfamily II DNA or RNA helicase
VTYKDFLDKKKLVIHSSGFEPVSINEMLFDFQRDIVRWACRKGKAAIWGDCGLGKTPMQLAWANEVVRETNGKVLILAPLAVASQTVREGEKFNIKVNICKTQDDVVEGINITNYEKLDKFVSSEFEGIVLDESSILKHFTSKTRTEIIENFNNTPFRLACTATPAPNDYMELANHAEFLGLMTRSEMLATYFVHDGGDTAKWRLKGHAQDKFWEWVASWAVVIRKPSDLGYEDNKFTLPCLNVLEHTVKVGDGLIAKTLIERREARKESLQERCQKAAELVNSSNEQWVVWCDLNCESELLKKSIAGAVEVKGSDTQEHKEKSVVGFSNKNIRVIVTKPSIAGFGINWQNCSNMIFVGLSDSYEAYYQAVRRCWRFGQENEVNANIIISEREGAVKANIERKEDDAERMFDSMVRYTQKILEKDIHRTQRETNKYEPIQNILIPNWLEVAI